jgi:hypothetical protein
MSRSLWLRAALAVALALGAAAGCKEEGPAEKAGRKLDDAFDKLTHPNEGPVERAGRKLGEAVDEAKEDARDQAQELKEKAADALEDDSR